MADPVLGIDTSVIVPTYNRAGLLPRLMESLLCQDYEAAYEVVVVDDGSLDETPEILRAWSTRHSDRIRVFSQMNSGPARARNRGAREARGRFLAFLDDDCTPEPSWLRSLQAASLTSSVGAVAGAIVNGETSWVDRYINRESVIAHRMSEDGSVLELITSNAGINANTFAALAGFDETIRVAGGEDTEFSLRLHQAGHRIAYAALARVHHEPKRRLSAYLSMIYRHGRGRRSLGERFPSYRIHFPILRLLWVAWPFRIWMLKDFTRYRSGGASKTESIRYVLIRYLENLVRIAGYLRGV
jgi:glycosyltransferase involved in cell wall biosynthesis